MKISTKGRYGLRAFIDLACYGAEEPVSISSISARQEISERYLEQLMAKLKKAGLVKSIRGAGGGYRLAKDAAEVSVGDVLRALEGDLEPATCAASSTYVAAVNEEPVIPEYDYMTIANTIDEIDRKIVTIKHTLNLTNATAKVQVGNQEMSIDSILIRMAQLNKRKAVLDDMRKRLPKMRVYSNSFSSSGSVPEYKYINYDLEVIRQEYDRISNTIMEMQIALDRYNQTVLFDVDI